MSRLGWTLGGMAAALAVPFMALAGPEQVTLPDDYRQQFTHYDSRDRDNPEQIAELYANDVALESAQDGPPLDHGSILVMEIYKAKLGEDGQPVTGDDGRRIKDSLSVIAVMQKEEGWGAQYPPELRNDDWQYAFFTPDDHTLVERDYTGCFECHKPLEEQDFVFSFDELSK